MSQMENDTGQLVYSEPRNVVKERFQHVSRGLIITVFVILVIYAGSRESLFLCLMASLLFGLLLYPAFLSLVLGLTGIHELKAYENGLVLPFNPSLKVNMRNGAFIPWRDVEYIYLNKNLRISKIFPYILIKLRNSYIAIPEGKIIDLSLFLKSVDTYTTIITDKEYRCGMYPVDYYPPSLEARLEDDSILLHYGEVVRTIHFKDIKKVKLNMTYQLLMVNGSRIGLLGMSRDDVERIRISHQNYLKGGSFVGISSPSGGVLNSEIENDESENDGTEEE